MTPPKITNEQEAEEALKEMSSFRWTETVNRVRANRLLELSHMTAEGHTWANKRGQGYITFLDTSHVSDHFPTSQKTYPDPDLDGCRWKKPYCIVFGHEWEPVPHPTMTSDYRYCTRCQHTE